LLLQKGDFLLSNVQNKWSKEEDENLRNAMRICQNNWKLIANKLEVKSGKNDSQKTPDDCKRRWVTISKGLEFNWNQASEDKLIELVSIKGKNWALFSKYFDGLQKDKIRKHYNKLMKRGRLPDEFGNFIIIKPFRPSHKNKKEGKMKNYLQKQH